MPYTFQTRIVEEKIIDAEFEEVTYPVSFPISSLYKYINDVLTRKKSICEKCIQKGTEIKNWISYKFKKHQDLYILLIWFLFCYGLKVFFGWLWWG